MRLLFLPTVLLVFILSTPSAAQAQIQEPELRGVDEPRTPADDDVSRGIGLNVVINNYGFGVGGEYRRVFAPYLEGLITLQVTGLRDVSEQTFTDFFFGQQVIPNKYQRAFSLPVTFGVRQRIFARAVNDNYRFYLGAGAGPVFAFSYPYFNDRNNNGYRENFPELGLVEPVNDIFTGLSDGTWHTGVAGELKLSLDIGQNFSNLTSIQFGYMFYYFRNGIQLMQPNQPVRIENPEPNEFPFELENGELVMEPFFDSQRFFGTPTINFIFMGMW